MERYVKREKSDVSSADVELSACHAASTDPRSVESAAAIARRLWDQGVDTRVRRGGRVPGEIWIVLGGPDSRLDRANVETAVTTPTPVSTVVRLWEPALTRHLVPEVRGGEVRAVQAQLSVALP